MPKGRMDRRGFLRRGVAGAAAGLVVSKMTAASHARVIGANDRIHIGLIGCGGRGRYIIKSMVQPSATNTAVAAICDIWKRRLETYPAQVEGLFGTKPKAYADYRKLLADPDLDAVIIATPAHQHAGQVIDAIGAGKHIYVEKPIAPTGADLETLNKCYDTVKASKLVIQHGSQGVSSPGARAVRKFIAERKLGKLFRVESTESSPIPYWIPYVGPRTEAETNWKAFLYNRADRPFDAHQHASWMGYHDFSSGAIGGWMSHFINFVHYTTQCDLPVTATTFGGKYALRNDPRCDAPDQVAVVLDYAEGFHTQFTSHFGSSIGSETTVFMFERGSIRTRFGHSVGNPTYSSEGVNEKLKPQKLLEVDPVYPGPDHAANWFDGIRNGTETNANMEYGYKQGIAVVMGDVAYSLGRKVAFDKQKREIRAVS